MFLIRLIEVSRRPNLWLAVFVASIAVLVLSGAAVGFYLHMYWVPVLLVIGPTVLSHLLSAALRYFRLREFARKLYTVQPAPLIARREGRSFLCLKHQGRVDYVLVQLATHANEAIARERSDPEEQRCPVLNESNNDHVRLALRAFWRMYWLARLFGYAVRTRWSDYLEPPIQA